MNAFWRWLIIVASYLVILLVTAAACFFAVLILAGPHGGLLPDSFQPFVLIAGWVTLLLVPLSLAHWLSRRLPKGGTRGRTR